ncbi:MAG: XdhC family protein [Acetobacter sp.]
MSSVPPSSEARNPFQLADDWLAAGQQVAFATVVGTGGRSPRPLGSVMVMSGSGRVEGSVSGGCVEGDVISTAGDVFAGAVPCMRSYGGEDMGLWSVGLACGGRLDVFVEAVKSSQSPSGTFPSEFLPRINACREAQEPVVIAFALDGSSHALLLPKGELLTAGDQPPAEIVARMKQHRAAGETGVVAPDTTPGWFVQTLAPPPRLIIVGAVHIAQALSGMAARIGYAVTIIDPRTMLATPARFPGVRLMDGWPDEALIREQPDRNTAIVTLTHDSKLDDPALLTALGTPAFYIGALGSRKTHASRLDRLRGEGVDEMALRRIRGPVGLPIGGIEVEEIAVSIIADIIAVRRHAPLAQEMAWWSRPVTTA